MQEPNETVEPSPRSARTTFRRRAVVNGKENWVTRRETMSVGLRLFTAAGLPTQRPNRQNAAIPAPVDYEPRAGVTVGEVEYRAANPQRPASLRRRLQPWHTEIAAPVHAEAAGWRRARR